MLEKMKIEKKEGTSYPVLPVDEIYQVELLDITMSEHGVYQQPDKKEKVFSFQFTVLNDGENRARNLWANFVPTTLFISKKGKNKLYQIIEAMLGREMTQEEEANLDTDFLVKLIGKQCKVMLEIKEGREKQFNNIIKFLPSKKDIMPLSDEEKEKCKVKSKDGEKLSVDNSEVKAEECPF